MRLRQLESPEPMADEDGDDGSRQARNDRAYEWSTCAATLTQAPLPRSRDGTPPGRISSVWNVETPMESGDGRCAGRPTVRAAESSSGTGTSEKRMLAAERQRESITGQIGQCPIRKDADADVVSHPKNDVKSANRRES
jgi:hypothetical protein